MREALRTVHKIMNTRMTQKSVLSVAGTYIGSLENIAGSTSCHLQTTTKSTNYKQIRGTNQAA